jgi:hypothetical protein
MAIKAAQLRDRLRKIAEAFPERVAAIQKSLALEAAAVLPGATPVDTGRLRNGWDVGIDTPSGYEPGAGKKTYPNNAAARMAKQIEGAPKLRTLLLTNNVPYASIWEAGAFQPPDPGPSKGRGRKGTKRRRATEGVVLVAGGYHTAAPAGMLSVGVAAIQKLLREYEAAGLELKKELGP